MMKTTLTILYPDKEPEIREFLLPKDPGYDWFVDNVRPIIGGWIEHFRVLHNGEYTDMFVDEEGKLKRKPLNVEATRIYRANWLKEYPHVKPESLDFIAGVAVLSSRQIWY